MERQVPGGRQRRVGGNHQLSRDGDALQEGYATASNDTGHKGGNALFAIEHPEKLVDFAYRAVHEMTVQSKAIIAAYYKRAAAPVVLERLLDRRPAGADGGAEVSPKTSTRSSPARRPTQTHSTPRDCGRVPVLKNPAAAVPADEARAGQTAVLDACDARDGVKDGLLNDPRACTFDVATLQCKAGDADDCLTAPQVATVKRAYVPAKTATGESCSRARIRQRDRRGVVGGSPPTRFGRRRSRSRTRRQRGIRRRSISIAT